MKFGFLLFALLAMFAAPAAMACFSPASVCSEAAEGSFHLVKDGLPASVILEPMADPAVQRVTRSFAADLKRVSGSEPRIRVNPNRLDNPAVLVGVAGESVLIDGLIEAGKLQVDSLAGQWEAYLVAVVPDPWPGVNSALVIVGSDRRGAVFGAYDLSAEMGVSPWHWFADAPVQQRTEVFITAGARGDQPGVRYRGLFINDEDPALSGWAGKLFGGVNAGMYEHVFELLLRLKGNFIWPAMWGKAFHVDDPRNTSLADEMGIIVGTSHHEPMTRAHAEWHKTDDDPAVGGAWNYESNAENLRKFWRGGIERMMSKGGGEAYESVVTVGMRGDGDEPMSEEAAIGLLETVVADQREIIADVTGRPASETPQVWALYKEVQEYYDKGMSVPDDVTLLFSDDNWGQVRRLPTQDLDRTGGYGVYYHFDYVGVPRNYKWNNTIQVGKVWQQMNLAYQRAARELWIVNVGDIKPVEFPLDFFLTMAWDPAAMTPDAMGTFAERWAGRVFGEPLAREIGDLLTRYGQYASMRKPELINENTFAIGEGTGLQLERGEFHALVEKWQALENDMESVKARISAEQHPAFFQLLEYPIASMANLYEMYFATAWNRRLAQHHDARANHFRERVERAFARDTALSDQYHALNGGKWDGMMSQVHMNYVIWNDPTQQTMPPVIRVNGGRNSAVEVEFAPQKGGDPDTYVLEASAFDKAVGGAGLTWQAIPGLGQSDAAMITLPQGAPATTVKDGVRLEYGISVRVDGDVRIALQLSPTLDTLGKGGISLGVSIDDGPVEVVNWNLLPTGGTMARPEEQDWGEAVINNRHREEIYFPRISSGEHTLKVWRLDDNVVLEKIEVSQPDANAPASD